MSKQSQAGTYYRPLPLDFEILDRLPPKGIIGGVHWAGVRLRHIARDINDRNVGADAVPMSVMQSRTRSMKIAGYVEDFPAVGGRIWARTEKGTEFLATREEVLGV